MAALDGAPGIAIGNAIGRTQKESRKQEGDLIVERWKRLAGIL